MLDYAANGVQYWSIDAIRLAAQQSAQRHRANLYEAIQSLLASEDIADPDAYWQTVEQILRRGQ